MNLIGVTGIEARKQSGTTGFFGKDLHGDVRYAFNSSGTKIADYTYDAWGNEESSSTSTWAQDNPVRYNGQYYDTETGMYYLRARYYDPQMSRFISEDPIEDGINWYAYAGNNPVMFADPSGLKDEAKNLITFNQLVTDLLVIKSEYSKTLYSYNQDKARQADGEARNDDSFKVDEQSYQAEFKRLEEKAEQKRTEIIEFVNTNFGSEELCRGSFAVVVESILNKGMYSSIEETSVLLSVSYYYRTQLDNIDIGKDYDLSLNALTSVFQSTPKNQLIHSMSSKGNSELIENYFYPYRHSTMGTTFYCDYTKKRMCLPYVFLDDQQQEYAPYSLD